MQKFGEKGDRLISHDSARPAAGGALETEVLS